MSFELRLKERDISFNQVWQAAEERVVFMVQCDLSESGRNPYRVKENRAESKKGKKGKEKIVLFEVELRKDRRA